VNFVEICNFCARKVLIKAAKRIINSDKMCRSYSDLNFGVTFWNTVYTASSANANVECYVGSCLVGVLAYADKAALLLMLLFLYNW